MYNSDEERTMIQAVSGNHEVPGVVVGVGSDVAENPQADRFRQKYNSGARSPSTSAASTRTRDARSCSILPGLSPRSIGPALADPDWQPLLPVPEHPRIRHLGFLDDIDKFDAMAAADLLVMPSYFESLSMVALEAWALGRPVLANGKCDVLKGQCIRSNAGLYYETYSSSSRRCARSSATGG